MSLRNYVISRLVMLLFLSILVFSVVSIFLTFDLSKEKLDIVKLFSVLILELPVAGAASIAIFYMFMTSDNKLSTFRETPSVSNFFLPSIMLAVVIVLVVIISQEILLPQLVKNKARIDGIKNVVFVLDKKTVVFVKEVKVKTEKLKGKSRDYFALRGVTLTDIKTGNIISYGLSGAFYPSLNSLVLGGRRYNFDVSLESVFLYFLDNTYFMSITDFPQVRDAFGYFGIKPNRVNFILYERIYIPFISLALMLFAITIGWSSRITRKTLLMPVYVLVGITFVLVIVKLTFYFFIRFFELIVFPF